MFLFQSLANDDVKVNETERISAKKLIDSETRPIIWILKHLISQEETLKENLEFAVGQVENSETSEVSEIFFQVFLNPSFRFRI